MKRVSCFYGYEILELKFFQIRKPISVDIAMYSNGVIQRYLINTICVYFILGLAVAIGGVNESESQDKCKNNL